MKKIPLTQRRFALVDDEDYEFLSKHKWRAIPNHKKTIWYAGRELDNTTIYLHRVVTRCARRDGVIIDHKNGDGLDCQKNNLRKCTKGQNGANCKSRAGSSSLFLGVSWCKVSKKWTTQMTVNKRPIRVGRYQTEREAAIAYNEEAKKYHGEFARLNPIQ